MAIFISTILAGRVAPESRENLTLFPLITSRDQSKGEIAMPKLIEQSKPIIGYEGLYEISNFGNVKSLGIITNNQYGGERILKPSVNSNGYYSVTLCKNKKHKTYFIHTLVWDHFGRENRDHYKFTIDHINDNKLCNRIDNLQILRQRDNVAKYYRSISKSSKYVGVYWNKKKQKYIAKIHHGADRIYLGVFENEFDAYVAYEKKRLEIINEAS
jgi:hypothetical protein